VGEAASGGGGTVGTEGSWHVDEAANGGGGTVGTEGSWHVGEAANGGGGTVGTERSWHVGEDASGGGGGSEGGVDTKNLKEDVVAVEVARTLCKADGESQNAGCS
jgi:hypothetical protein